MTSFIVQVLPTKQSFIHLFQKDMMNLEVHSVLKDSISACLTGL